MPACTKLIPRNYQKFGSVVLIVQGTIVRENAIFVQNQSGKREITKTFNILIDLIQYRNYSGAEFVRLANDSWTRIFFLSMDKSFCSLFNVVEICSYRVMYAA